MCLKVHSATVAETYRSYQKGWRLVDPEILHKGA